MIKSGFKTTTFILIIITALIGILVNGALKIEKREICHTINKLNLSHFRNCYNLVSGNTLDRINKCLSGSLSSEPTGDAFVVDLRTLKVVWDNSVDCKVGNTPKLTRNSICKIAKDPKSCVELGKKLRLGYDGEFIWNFDGSPEVDDWIIIPDELHNLDGSLRANVGLRTQYAVVQGCQLDEIEKKFDFIEILFNIMISILLFFELLLFMFASRERICTSNHQCEYKL